MRQVISILCGIATMSFIVLGFILPAEAEECRDNSLVYIPYEGFKLDNPPLGYEIEIKKNVSYVPSQYGTKLLFKLSTYDPLSGDLLSVFNMPYDCAGGSYPMCYLHPLKERPMTKISVATLDRNFSPQSLGGSNAPYALVFPDIGVEFYRLDWDKIETITYVKNRDDKVFTSAHRPIFVPTVWIRKSCEATFNGVEK